jgi:hypothetical protein
MTVMRLAGLISIGSVLGCQQPAEGPRAMDGGGEASTADTSEAGVSFPLDAADCMISTYNYPLSCTTDSDCVGVVSIPGFGQLSVISGNFCGPLCSCVGAYVIGQQAVSQYVADVAKTPFGSGKIPTVPCGCPEYAPAGCLNGTCVAALQPAHTTAPLSDAANEASLNGGEAVDAGVGTEQ